MGITKKKYLDSGSGSEHTAAAPANANAATVTVTSRLHFGRYENLMKII
jgi:hypothetical protein